MSKRSVTCTLQDLPARMSAAEYRTLVAAQPHLVRQSRKRTRRGGLDGGGAQSEEHLHRECFEWILEHESRWPILERMFHPANGGARSKGEGGKLKAMGVRPGVPDFMLPIPVLPWNGLAIELKIATGALTKKQEEWAESLTKGGYLVGVARSLEEFVSLVMQFLRGADDSRAAPCSGPT